MPEGWARCTSCAGPAVNGSGGAAFAAALHGTGLGKSVVMVQRGTFGGTCVNTACVPSKALIAADRGWPRSRQRLFPGIATTADAVDMPALVGGRQDLVEALRGEKYGEVKTGEDGEIVVTGRMRSSNLRLGARR